MSFILIDLDHTVANSFWRDSMIGVKSWDEYHAASKDDKPFSKMIELINALMREKYMIIAITGRTDNHRGTTLNWLIKHGLIVHDLLMRPEEEYLKNAEMKVEMVKRYFNNELSVIDFLIEDNEETCLAFQKLGVTTLQVRNIA